MASLRVASFNIQHGRTPGGEVDAALVGRTCAGLRADVLGLQEVDVGVTRSGEVDEAAVVATATGMSLLFVPAMDILPDGRYGNALLVRGAIGDADVLALPHATGQEPRAAAVADVDVEGFGHLSVAVTHLSIDTREAVGQLGVVLAALSSRRPPRVLLGDLNLPPRVVGVAARAAGFRLVGGPPTFPAHRPRKRIDHVALDGCVEIAVATPPVPVSDHRPLVVDVRVDHTR